MYGPGHVGDVRPADGFVIHYDVPAAQVLAKGGDEAEHAARAPHRRISQESSGWLKEAAP